MTMHLPPPPPAAVTSAAPRRRSGPVALGALAALSASAERAPAPAGLRLVAAVLAPVADVPAVEPRRAIPERDAVIVRWVERGGKDYPIFRRGVYAAPCLMGGAVVLYAVTADGELGIWKGTAAGQTEDELAAELWAWLEAHDPVVALT